MNEPVRNVDNGNMTPGNDIPKLVHIVVDVVVTDHPNVLITEHVLVGLDERGELWRFDRKANVWDAISMRRRVL